MAEPTYTYTTIAHSGNAPDMDRLNAMAAEGWELDQFNGDVPPGGGTRQWIFILRKRNLPVPET